MATKRTPAPKAETKAAPAPGTCRAGHGRYGFPAKMADCTSKVHVTEKGNAKQLCLAHEREYAQRPRARKAAEKAKAPKAKRAATKDNVVSIDAVRDQLPAGVLADEPLAPEAVAAFANVELAERAVAKRRGAKGQPK